VTGSDAGSDGINNEDNSARLADMTRNEKESWFKTDAGTIHRTKHYHTLTEGAKNVNCVVCSKQCKNHCRECSVNLCKKAILNHPSAVSFTHNEIAYLSCFQIFHSTHYDFESFTKRRL
jgi:hypothetical protein